MATSLQRKLGGMDHYMSSTKHGLVKFVAVKLASRLRRLGVDSIIC